MSISSDVVPPTHLLLFPFPPSGHILPLLDLAHTLLNHSFTITIIITPSNLPLLKPLQSIHPPDSLHTLVLPFPKLTDPSSTHGFIPIFRSISKLHGPILEWFRAHPSPPVAIISDFILGWTKNLVADQLGIPRIVFWSSGAIDSLTASHIWRNIEEIVYASAEEDNSLISFPNVPNSPEFPAWQVIEIPRQFVKGDPDWEFLKEGFLINDESWGAIFNSFADLDGDFIDNVKKEMGHDRVWSVGPLLPNSSSWNRCGSSVVPHHHHQLMTWLNDKVADSVLYVCFGSRSILTSQQVGILADALECSGVHFIWRVDLKLLPDGYEDRVADRGLILKDWAPQVEILRHRAVGAFLTHCGWNSLMEGITTGVLMLTWALDTDQFINARLLVDELGLAIRACEGGPKIIPDPAELAQILAHSMSSDQPKRVVVKKFRDAAAKAVESEGSSSKDMNALIKQLNELR